MSDDGKVFAIQWVRIPDTGPIGPGDIDNGPALFMFLKDVQAGDYDPSIGDHMVMVRTPYSPNGNGLATMHPGDWLYFAKEGNVVIVPDHIHRALTDGLVRESKISELLDKQ